ncbi:MAG: hypothetical protein IBJ14_16335 [Hydrogenophaga sp.]|nr:hypothetical protein [Hydrogenophaga sp.]
MFPPVRSAPLWLALMLGLPALAATPDDALRAADPASPAAALPLPLPDPQRLDPPEQPDDLARARSLWREANQRVAEFPRGHIDLLRWEAAHARAEPDTAAPPALGLAEALRASLRQRPDLFTHAGMNALAQARVRVAYAGHVRDVQQAWTDAVTARERVQLRAAVLDASRSGSELGRRMVRAGNWPAARLMQEQLIESAAWQAQADAALAAHATIEHLAGLMGVWRADEVRALGERLGAGLPALPARAGDGLAQDGIEAAVLRADPTLALEADPARRAFAGLPAGRWAAWETARDAAIAALPDPATGNPTPPHIDNLALLRETRLQEADEHRARLLARASERRAMARNAWAQLQARHAGARHAEQVVAGLKDAQQQETLLRYNGMFDSTWQLLASARERLDALDAALVARRDFWRAQAAWQALIAGAGFTPDSAPGAARAATPTEAGGH